MPTIFIGAHFRTRRTQRMNWSHPADALTPDELTPDAASQVQTPPVRTPQQLPVHPSFV